MPPTGHQKNEEKEPCDHNNGGEDGAGHPQEARRKLSEATAEELRNLVAAAIDRMKGAWDETKAENFANSFLERLSMDGDAVLPTPFGLTLLCTEKMLAEHGTGSGGSAFGDGVSFRHFCLALRLSVRRHSSLLVGGTCTSKQSVLACRHRCILQYAVHGAGGFNC